MAISVAISAAALAVIAGLFLLLLFGLGAYGSWGLFPAFFGVLSGQGQVKALEAAEASSQSALEANQLGYQVGVRINIDVLNSQSQLFDTKAKLAKARYDVLVGGLKLRQATGILKDEDLQPINAQLVP